MGELSFGILNQEKKRISRTAITVCKIPVEQNKHWINLEQKHISPLGWALGLQAQTPKATETN